MPLVSAQFYQIGSLPSQKEVTDWAGILSYLPLTMSVVISEVENCRLYISLDQSEPSQARAAVHHTQPGWHQLSRVDPSLVNSVFSHAIGRTDISVSQ